MGSAPPIGSQFTSSTSNPYSARSALNRKIYEPAPTAPTTLATDVLPTALSNSAPIPTSQNIFIPPSPMEPLTFQAPSVATINTPNLLSGPPNSLNTLPSSSLSATSFNQAPPLTQSYNEAPMLNYQIKHL